LRTGWMLPGALAIRAHHHALPSVSVYEVIVTL